MAEVRVERSESRERVYAMIQSYEDLLVYRKAYDISLEIHRQSLALPRQEQYELASQIRRSSKSVAINIAEGHGKDSSPAEFKRYLTIARGSAIETRVHLRYCVDLGYLDETEYQHLDSKYEEISKMLYKLIKVWK